MRHLVATHLRDRRRSVLAWGISLGLWSAFIVSIFPSIRDELLDRQHRLLQMRIANEGLSALMRSKVRTSRPKRSPSCSAGLARPEGVSHQCDQLFS